MKIARVTCCYLSYLSKMELRLRKSPELTYQEAFDLFMSDRFGWSDAWSYNLRKSKIEACEFVFNFDYLQRVWAKENGVKTDSTLIEICVEQLKKFKPDVLWFDESNSLLLKTIREKIPSIRLVLGWSGSAIYESDVWDHQDVILSCAQEAVDYFNKRGKKSYQLHHAFDERILSQLSNPPKVDKIIFAGQIIRDSSVHIEREKLLIEISKLIDLEIYSPSYEFGYLDELKSIIKFFIGRKNKLQLLVNPTLKKLMHPPAFGMEMYNLLESNLYVLNIHADSSPVYASNMRLFESPGVGACLITDYKKNLIELFNEDEVVVYKTPEDLKEKLIWLKANKEESLAIGLRAQKKIMNQHLFIHRVPRLLEIIKENI